MKVNKPEENKEERKQLEDGTYSARVYSVIDLGTQQQKELIGGEWKPKVLRDFNTQEAVLDDNGKEQLVYRREVNVSLEIPSELIKYEKDGEDVEFPFAVHKNYIVSLHEKAGLTKLVIASGLTVDDFNTDQLIGKTVLVTIGKTSGGKDKITNVSGLPKGMEVGDAVNPTKIFSLDEFDQKVFDALPEWQRDTIDSSQERGGIKSEVKDVDPSEIAF